MKVHSIRYKNNKKKLLKIEGFVDLYNEIVDTYNNVHNMYELTKKKEYLVTIIEYDALIKSLDGYYYLTLNYPDYFKDS